MNIQSRVRDLLWRTSSFIVEESQTVPKIASQYSDDVVVEALQRVLAQKNKELVLGRRCIEDCRGAVAELETMIAASIEDVAADEADIAKIEAAIEAALPKEATS